MDVTFSNVLEGARQYFQGLPAATGSTASPAYSSADGHHRNDTDQQQQSNELPPSSSSAYWPPPQDVPRPPTREHTPVQRPPSHHSDSSRPPSHSQYIPNMPPNEPGRPPTQYQQAPPSYQEQHQSFQFSRPQSREAPSNYPSSQQYQPHIPNSPYHRQQPSPQQVIPHSQSPSQSTYQNYTQPRSYYPPQTKQVLPNNNSYKPPSSQSYPTHPQSQNSYYKHIYSTQSQPQPTVHQNHYVTSRASTVLQDQPSQHSSSTYNMPNENNEQAYRTTHNLPPIASLSSVNYHSSRVPREPSRPSSNSRPRTLSSSSSTSSLPPNSMPSSSGTSIIQQNPMHRTSSVYASETYQNNYRANVSSYSNQPTRHNQTYQYSTATTQAYNNVIMTATNSTPSYSTPVQSQSSANNHYYQTVKSNVPPSRPQPIVNHQNHQQHSIPPQSNVDRNINGRLAPANKQKRESPLDLSVKTVRTPADSTLDEDNEARNKHYAIHQRTSSHSTISTYKYPTYDVNSFQRNLTQRSNQLQTSTSTGAPKIEFQPDFNVPALNHQQPPSRIVENQRNINNSVSNIRNRGGMAVPYQNSTVNRYPTVSIPSAAHVNSYIQSHHVPKKPTVKNLPRQEFPTPNIQSHKAPLYPPHDIHKKRASDQIIPQVIPNKMPKMEPVEPWRQTIDDQIEQRLSDYKQQHSKFTSVNNKPTLPNGNYHQVPTQEKSKNPYNVYQKSSYENVAQHPSYSNYNPQNNHNQTYVPSPASHPYPGYGGYAPPQQQQQTAYLQPSSRSNSNPSLPTIANNAKNNLGGAADKRVLSLLRNSLEVKGQKKLEQLKSHDNLHQHHRSDVQHPSTDVTAPLQPKPGFISRNNVSPFTPTSFPESNITLTTMYKFQLPRAIDSVNFDLDCKNVPSVVENNHPVIPNTGNSNSDYDGLAAFLAARIRTKGELKQGGPTQNVNSNNNTNSLHGLIENQLKSPIKQDSSQSSAYCSTSSNKSASPPKLLKEQRNAVFPPRRRLFSRNEEDNSNHNNVPLRDKSGLRSSSETSVFDFPDTDSENEMPVLERQSLEAMRRDRKSSIKHAVSNPDIKLELSRPASPEDDIFAQLVDNFVEQLKSGVIKKKTRRKKVVEPEMLAQLETVAKQNSLESDLRIKLEVEDIKEENVEVQNTTPSTIESKPLLESVDEKMDAEDIINKEKKEMVRRRLLSSSDSSDSELETKNKIVGNCKENSAEDKPKDEKTVKTGNELIPVSRPVKKPSFGDGSDFYPGWEEGVYKYKKSLRMPASLIQVTRPPQFHRLSTSLPDLDPCPNSPTTSIVSEHLDIPNKNKLKKIKSEPIDSDCESNSSFNLFSKHNNYDSEGSSSITSLPSTTKGGTSILDKLLEKYGGKKRKKYKKKDENLPKIIPKAENPIELLPTPSLEISTETNERELKKLASPVIKTESPLLGFRKKTINNFKETFLKSTNLVGVNEQFATVVLKSRTRKETRVLKQKATIKEVFGEDRPASAPPVTCVNDIESKDDLTDRIENINMKTQIKEELEIALEKLPDTKQMLKNKLLSKGKKKDLLKTLVDKKIKTEPEELENVIKIDIDAKSETLSVDGDDISVSGKKRSKLRNIRRKFSSGFDYIRKKKKTKKDNIESDTTVVKPKRRGALPKTSPESVQDIQKEIKTWVLNKGIGETHLHRAARLGYTDITAYCLEKMECMPSPKDNAGYTPLHEACSRGHLDIAKLLLLFGANVSESAQGGIRPLHEAVENGFVEIVRLLLSYGADPTLATYSGLTPLSLANDDATAELLRNHLSDVQGIPGPPWQFVGPASCFETNELGYNIVAEVPDPDPELEPEDIEIEESDTTLPNLYTLRGEAQSDRWILWQDLSNMLKIKSRDALLRQICPSPTSSSSTAPLNHKAILRELKMSDFLEQAHCCSFLNAGEKINTRASKIALVKYTDKVRELLNVERVLITVR